VNVSVDPAAKRWLIAQTNVIREHFERSFEELDSAGIRLKTGSSVHISDETSDIRKIWLTPSRFLGQKDDNALILSLIATAERGPRRFELALEVSGSKPLGALLCLSGSGEKVWQRICFQNGLWIRRNGNTAPLRNLQQLTEDRDVDLIIAAAFLDSESPNTVVEGIMLLGTVYRCILDELCDASRMPKLCNALVNRLGGRVPTFPKVIRPSI
jgi:hypothetical protein